MDGHLLELQHITRPVPTVGKYLGSGGFGFVFEEYPGAITHRALKIIITDNVQSIPGRSSNTNATANFERTKQLQQRRTRTLHEYNIIAHKTHKNIVRLIDHFETTYSRGELQSLLQQVRGDQRVGVYILQGDTSVRINTMVIRMDLCGPTLKQWLDLKTKNEVDFNLEEISHFQVEIVKGLIEGLKFLHKYRIMHRDLKPANAMFAYAGGSCDIFILPIQIGDFGLCRKMRGEESAVYSFPTCNVGTPIYQAQEVVLGIYYLQADLFSLGLMVWEVVQLIPQDKRKEMFDRLVNNEETELVVGHPKILNAKEIIIGLTKKNLENRVKSIDQVVPILYSGDEDGGKNVETPLANFLITGARSRNLIKINALGFLIILLLTLGIGIALTSIVFLVVVLPLGGIGGTNLVDKENSIGSQVVSVQVTNVEELRSALENRTVRRIQLTNGIYEINFPIRMWPNLLLEGMGSDRTVLMSNVDCPKCDNETTHFLEVVRDSEIRGLAIIAKNVFFSTFVIGKRNEVEDILLNGAQLYIRGSDNYVSYLTLNTTTANRGSTSTPSTDKLEAIQVPGHRNKFENLRFSKFTNADSCLSVYGSSNTFDTIVYNRIQTFFPFYMAGEENKIRNVVYEYHLDNLLEPTNDVTLVIASGSGHEIRNVTCVFQKSGVLDPCDLNIRLHSDSQNVTVRDATFAVLEIEGVNHHLINISKIKNLEIKGSSHKIENCFAAKWTNEGSNITVIGGNCFGTNC